MDNIVDRSFWMFVLVSVVLVYALFIIVRCDLGVLHFVIYIYVYIYIYCLPPVYHFWMFRDTHYRVYSFRTISDESETKVSNFPNWRCYCVFQWKDTDVDRIICIVPMGGVSHFFFMQCCFFIGILTFVSYSPMASKHSLARMVIFYRAYGRSFILLCRQMIKA